MIGTARQPTRSIWFTSEVKRKVRGRHNTRSAAKVTAPSICTNMRRRLANLGDILADAFQPIGDALLSQPFGIRKFRGLVDGIDDHPELVRQADHIGLHALLPRPAQQAFEQPGAIGIELGDTAHVDTKAFDHPWLCRGRLHHLLFECVGVIRRPFSASREIKPLAADRAGEQRCYAHHTPRPVCPGRSRHPSIRSGAL